LTKLEAEYRRRRGNVNGRHRLLGVC